MDHIEYFPLEGCRDEGPGTACACIAQDGMIFPVVGCVDTDVCDGVL